MCVCECAHWSFIHPIPRRGEPWARGCAASVQRVRGVSRGARRRGSAERGEGGEHSGRPEMCTCVRVRSGRPSSSSGPSPGVTSADASPLSPAGRCLCVSVEKAYTERGLPVPLSRLVCPGFVSLPITFYEHCILFTRITSELSNSFFLFFINPEPERRRRAKEEEWGRT